MRLLAVFLSAVFNILASLVSIGLIVFGVYFLVDRLDLCPENDDFSMEEIEKACDISNNIWTWLFVTIICIGAFGLMFGAIALIGVWHENVRLLRVVAAVMSIFVLILFITIIICGVAYREDWIMATIRREMNDLFALDVRNYVSRSHRNLQRTTVVLGRVENVLQCCGNNGLKDYQLEVQRLNYNVTIPPLTCPDSPAVYGCKEQLIFAIERIFDTFGIILGASYAALFLGDSFILILSSFIFKYSKQQFRNRHEGNDLFITDYI